jgi:hypothetical protein
MHTIFTSEQAYKNFPAIHGISLLSQKQRLASKKNERLSTMEIDETRPASKEVPTNVPLPLHLS